MKMKPVLLGCEGPVLSEAERALFAAENPFGFILFARNCENPDQLRALTSALRAAVGRTDVPIFIDQEGGRVARLRPPHWPALPAGRAIGVLYEKDRDSGLEAMRLHATVTARFLLDMGIDGNCTPLLDLSVPGTSPVMGDRVFSDDPDVIAALGRVAVETYLACGVFPVVKHLPGHGRVKVDPHEVLPFVDADGATLEADFAPFRALADCAPIGMNAHVVYTALDADNPASLSKKIHEEIIRGKIGFNGLVFSDDLAMKALSLPLAESGVKALTAGADIVLYCPGILRDSQEVCAALPAMSDKALARWEKAKASRASLPARTAWAAELDRFNGLIGA